jgi:type VI secretion system protein ImpF
MSIGQSSMLKYSPSLLERLADDVPSRSAEREPLKLITAEALKESVARDMESLLNARCAFSEDAFADFPEAFHSVCSYGMNDFVGLSLASPADRNHICRCLERTIATHESRLKEVRVSLTLDPGAINRLKFAIAALLVIHPSTEPVSFDALLQPSTLQYSVNKGRRMAPA